MFKIRDFAEIAQVSMSMLRYYDEIGLFKPAHVDPLTGYRFYSIDQLLRLNRILALKDLGLELALIVQFLDEEMTANALQGMLRLKQAQLQQRIQAEQEQLASIEARLKYIEHDGSKLAHEVVLKAVKPYTVLASRTRVTGFVPNVQYARALLTMLKQNGIEPKGSTLYLYDENVSSKEIEAEVAVPVDLSSMPTLSAGWEDRITLRELPGVPRIASTLYHGTPHAIAEAYQALGTWIAANNYIITGPCRKVCLRWSGDLNDYLTEIQFPVEMES